MLIFRLSFIIPLLLLMGCERREFSAMKSTYGQKEVFRVGVIPFENLTPNIKAGEDMSRYAYSEFFRTLYQDHEAVVGPFRFELEDEHHLREILEKKKWLDQSAHLDVGLANMADTLGLDLILLGTVSEYHYKRGLGEDPVASLHLRLYERRHDTIIWSGSHSKVGHFSWFKEDSLGRLSRQLCRELVEKLMNNIQEQAYRRHLKHVEKNIISQKNNESVINPNPTFFDTQENKSPEVDAPTSSSSNLHSPKSLENEDPSAATNKNSAPIDPSKTEAETKPSTSEVTEKPSSEAMTDAQEKVN